ncbi:MAG: hypothetical protein COB04_02720 [Gammaproteobacteria bacterium]|nr:MAG: hypothetical protein COB04_02720 [Gammaproteobacteria bacterium]
MSRSTLLIIGLLTSAALVAFLSNRLIPLQYPSPNQAEALADKNPSRYVNINQNQTKTLFYEYIDRLSEQSGPVSIDNIISSNNQNRWVQSSGPANIPSYGYTNKAVWLKFKVVNNSAESIDKVIDIPNPLLDKIDVYIRPEAGIPTEYHVGDSYPFASRPIQQDTFILPLLLDAYAKADIYIRVESTSSLKIPVEIWDTHASRENALLFSLLASGFTGICLVMLTINLLIYLSTKEIGYFYYTLYVSSMSLLVIGASGYGYQYLWPSSPWFQGKFMSIFIPPMLFSTLLFGYNFLELSKAAAYIRWAIKSLVATSMGLFVIGFFLPWVYVAIPNSISVVIITPSLLLLAIKRLIDGDPNAKLYVIAWLPLNVAFLTTALSVINILSWKINVQEIMITIVFEMILISLVLTEKIKREKNKQQQAQNLSLKNLQKYEELYNHAIEGMFSYDETNQNFKCNQAFLKLFNDGPAQSINSLSDIISHIPEQERLQVISDLEQKIAIKNFEAPIISSDTSDQVWVSMTIKASHSNHENSFVYNGVFVDISERIRKEKADLARDQALKNEAISEEKNRVKSEFFASMSHEYRTPLNAIIGFTDILGNQNLNASQRKMLGYINTGGQDLLALVNDVLDISKIEAQKFDFEKIEMDILPVLAHIEASFSVLANKKGIQFTVDYQHPLPKKILTDPVRVKQTILNLCSNAIKFTHQGEVVLQVRCELKQETMYFSVKDTGIGLKQEQLASLFVAYAQAEKSTSREFGGTGLGLSLSKNIAQNLGGDIVVKSELGRGSTFTLFIDTGSLENVEIISCSNTTDQSDLVVDAESPGPRNDSIDDNNIYNDQAANSEYVESEDRHSFDRVNSHPNNAANLPVLLVEDNIVNQKLISQTINQSGLECTIAENGLEAIAYVMLYQYGLVFMDIHMPHLSGLEAVKFLRAKEIDLEIIALSGDTTQDDIQRSLDAGFDAHIAKPVDLTQLRNILQNTIKRNGSIAAS